MFTCCVCQPQDDCQAFFDGGNVQMSNASKIALCDQCWEGDAQIVMAEFWMSIDSFCCPVMNTNGHVKLNKSEATLNGIQ